MKILFIEPFYGGSHKNLIDVLTKEFNNYELYSLPATKWHWRARTSALHFSETIPADKEFGVIFCSSVLNLAELIALRHDLRGLKKIVYFHENQFIYPVRERKDRDFQYGYNQIITALTADCVVFNSNFNMETFLQNINHHLGIQPDNKIRHLESKIRPKCRVIYFPVSVPKLISSCTRSSVLHIIWPHRWEHDKNPELFFKTLFKLQENGMNFRLILLGQSFQDPPEIFHEAKSRLEQETDHWGLIDDKLEYYQKLQTGHLVVSTAEHEFFGVAMLEAVLCGCFPLAPNTLVYPEIYPSNCLYNTPQQLYKKLAMFCKKPYLSVDYYKRTDFRLDRFRLDCILPKLAEIIKF